MRTVSVKSVSPFAGMIRIRFGGSGRQSYLSPFGGTPRRTPHMYPSGQERQAFVTAPQPSGERGLRRSGPSREPENMWKLAVRGAVLAGLTAALVACAAPRPQIVREIPFRYVNHEILIATRV